MFHDLDETLRQLLIRELPVKKNEIDIKFDQPSRDWSSRISRPTLNLFLYDIRENVKVRGSQQWIVEKNPDGTATQKRVPPRIALRYMVTAWANDPDDEHNLLARAMMAFYRHPHIPDDLLPKSLQDQPVPIPIEVAQEDILRNPADVWNVLDNEVRPAIPLVVTVALDPYRSVVTPLAHSRSLRMGQIDHSQSAPSLETEGQSAPLWTIGGTVRTDKSLETLRLTLVERGLNVPLQDNGQFFVARLRAGEYTLEVTADDQVLKRLKVTVPAPDFDLQV